MINLRIIARAFSQVLIIESLFMLLSAGVSWLYGEHTAGSFLLSAIITLVSGVLVFTPLRNEEKVYGTREGFIITTGIWIVFSLFSSLPYLFSGSTNNFPDAFFESVSGFTTTGATIFTDVESLPKGILFWRSLTQWLGGISIIILSLYVFPVIKALNIQLTTEFSGPAESKIHPKVIETAKRLIGIYFFLTLLEAVLLYLGKMPVFDAVCHSFSTLSTGGFSTRNACLSAFSSPFLKAILTFFMFLAGTNLALLYHVLKGHFKKITGNNEFVFYVILVIGFSLLVSAVLFLKSGVSVINSIQNGFLQVISIITTTGFHSADYNQWGNFLILIIFILMFTGGMAGSTSGGIKIVRLLIITINSRKESRKLVHPDAFLPVRIDKKRVPQNIVHNLLVFITLYFIVVCAGALIFSFMDYDLITSFSTIASMLGNIGPGIGTFGPFSTYSEIPVAGKFFLSFLMLLGRLELLAVIILFTRNFYRR